MCHEAVLVIFIKYVLSLFSDSVTMTDSVTSFSLNLDFYVLILLSFPSLATFCFFFNLSDFPCTSLPGLLFWILYPQREWMQFRSEGRIILVLSFASCENLKRLSNVIHL